MDQRAGFKVQRYARKIVADVPRILVPAAEYKQMSDEAQQYSIDNQKAALLFDDAPYLYQILSSDWLAFYLTGCPRFCGTQSSLPLPEPMHVPGGNLISSSSQPFKWQALHISGADRAA